MTLSGDPELHASAGRVFVNKVLLGAYAALVRAPGNREAKAATIVRCLPGLGSR
ncbi:hypothetical protein [Amycolatopsis sp. lyj-23]|uniref:hypothetical protein n=1 Tax=Amycolatopsis sp. lyj-23 TaxID=2789283 RepID=UPI00397D0720